MRLPNISEIACSFFTNLTLSRVKSFILMDIEVTLVIAFNHQIRIPLQKHLG